MKKYCGRKVSPSVAEWIFFRIFAAFFAGVGSSRIVLSVMLVVWYKHSFSTQIKSPMYYIITFLVIVALELLYFLVAKKLHIVDRPNERSSHRKVALLGAGIIFSLSLLYYSATHGFAFLPFVLAAVLLAVVSYVDDMRGLPSWLRMFVQIAAVVIGFYSSIYALHVWQLLLLIVLFVGVLNVYNFMDGINGMLAAYSMVVVGTFGYLNLFETHFINTDFMATVMMAILVFGFFNFRNNARCFSGDVGSIVMGFVVLFLLLKYDNAVPDNGENVSYLCFIIVFLADGLLTIFKRFLTGRNIFEAHREHLYETLVNNLHVPHLRVSSCYALLQLAINVGYILSSDKNLYTLIVAFMLVLVYGLFFYYCNVKKNVRF